MHEFSKRSAHVTHHSADNLSGDALCDAHFVESPYRAQPCLLCRGATRDAANERQAVAAPPRTRGPFLRAIVGGMLGGLVAALAVVVPYALVEDIRADVLSARVAGGMRGLGRMRTEQRRQAHALASQERRLERLGDERALGRVLEEVLGQPNRQPIGQPIGQPVGVDSIAQLAEQSADADAPSARDAEALEVVALGPGEYLVARTTLLSDAAWRGARWVRGEHRGAVVGTRVLGVRSSSLLARLGIEDGDTLVSVNGVSLRGGRLTPEVRDVLRDSTAINLVLLRDGTPLWLRYTIVG